MTDRIRLYLDEDTINRALIAGLRARNVDVLTAQEAVRIGMSDETRYCIWERRIIGLTAKGSSRGVKSA